MIRRPPRSTPAARWPRTAMCTMLPLRSSVARSVSDYRGASRLRRGASERGGLGGPFQAPHGRVTRIEGRPGFAGTSPSVGGLGGPFEAPHVSDEVTAVGVAAESAALAEQAPRFQDRAVLHVVQVAQQLVERLRPLAEQRAHPLGHALDAHS